MGQLGFFDADKRLEALSAKGDPLEAIDHLVPWESFRAEIESVVLTPDELKKRRKSERTTPRAGYALASSICSGRSRARRAVGSGARSASCGCAKIGLQNLAY